MPARLRAKGPSRKRPSRLFMTADAVGGVWSYALDLARGPALLGIETTLAVLGPAPDAEQAEQAHAIPGLRLLATGLPLDWTAESCALVEEAGAAVAALAAEARADIVHLNSPALATARFTAPVVGVCHSCVATWWQAVRSGPLPPEFQWRTDLLRKGYESVDALIAPTAAFAAATVRTYGLATAPTVVHNGRSPAPAGVSGFEDCVFTAGRLWDEGKNVAVLDRAAARLGVPVVAAGPLEGPNGARIELPHVQALGRVSESDIARRLRARPVFASLARYEPFGLAVLEAAQAGSALVLSDIPTFRELWDGAAVFVPPEDDETVAAALTDVIGNPTRRAKLGKAARERSRRYTVDAMTAGVVDVYRSVLGGSPVVVDGRPLPAREAAA